jgi:hypothetical protein
MPGSSRCWKLCKGLLMMHRAAHGSCGTRDDLRFHTTKTRS